MRSRVLIGVGGWLLGALVATGGSLYAVDQLGEGLLEQQTKQVSVASQGAGTVTPGLPDRARPLSSRGPSAPGAAATSKLLSSAGGTADAICRSGLAHLLYWSPAQGFDVFRVQPGPRSQASVTFTDSSGGVTMRVGCTSSGIPVASTSSFQSGGGSDHDE